MRIATVSVWSVVILIFVAGILFLPTLQTINSRYMIAKEQMERLEQSGAIAKAVDIEALVARTSVLTEKLAVAVPPSPMEYMQYVQKYRSDGIRITGYEMSAADKPIMQIRGVASTRENLQQFVGLLQAEPAVATVDSPVANFVKSSQSEFMITVTFKTL